MVFCVMEQQQEIVIHVRSFRELILKKKIRRKNGNRENRSIFDVLFNKTTIIGGLYGDFSVFIRFHFDLAVR